MKNMKWVSFWWLSMRLYYSNILRCSPSARAPIFLPQATRQIKLQTRSLVCIRYTYQLTWAALLFRFSYNAIWVRLTHPINNSPVVNETVEQNSFHRVHRHGINSHLGQFRRFKSRWFRANLDANTGWPLARTTNSSTSTKFKKNFRIDPFFICVIAAVISKLQSKRAIGRGSWRNTLIDPAK
jgi:hypothetical protein